MIVNQFDCKVTSRRMNIAQQPMMKNRQHNNNNNNDSIKSLCRCFSRKVSIFPLSISCKFVSVCVVPYLCSSYDNKCRTVLDIHRSGRKVKDTHTPKAKKKHKETIHIFPAINLSFSLSLVSLNLPPCLHEMPLEVLKTTANDEKTSLIIVFMCVCVSSLDERVVVPCRLSI